MSEDKAKNFLDIAHKYLVFRDDWDVLFHNMEIRFSNMAFCAYTVTATILRQFQESIERAGVLSTNKQPIFIEGPRGSGKGQLARAIADARGDRFSLLDAKTEPADHNEVMIDNTVGDETLLVSHIEDVSDISLQFPAYMKSNYLGLIITSTHGFKEIANTDKFPAKLRNTLRNRVLHLPMLKERRWDIIPNLVYSVREVANDIQVDYISFNALDFMLYYGWPGNIKELYSVIENAARFAQSTSEPNIINFDDVRMCFPRKESKAFVTDPCCKKWLDDPSEYTYDHRLALKRDHDVAQFVDYTWEAIIRDVGCPECAGYLLETTFFKYKGHYVPGPMWNPLEEEEVTDEEVKATLGYLPYYQAEYIPPFKLTEHRRNLSFHRMESVIEGCIEPLPWIVNADKVREDIGKNITFSSAEAILFNIKKMVKDLERFMPSTDIGLIPEYNSNVSAPKTSLSPQAYEMSQNIFRVENKVYHLRFKGGLEKTIPADKGMSYIAKLLANPKNCFDSVDLWILIEGKQIGEYSKDGTAKESENARIRIRNAINRAYEKITDEGYGNLAQYLGIHIKYHKGEWQYSPDEDDPAIWKT